MTQLLPRFTASLERMRDEQAIAKAVLEAAPNEEPATVARATLGGDSFRLRGIPVCARGVGGVSPGTDPLAALVASERLR